MSSVTLEIQALLPFGNPSSADLGLRIFFVREEAGKISYLLYHA